MNNLEKDKELKEKYNNGNCDDVMWEGIRQEAKAKLEKLGCGKYFYPWGKKDIKSGAKESAWRCGDEHNGKILFCEDCEPKQKEEKAKEIKEQLKQTGDLIEKDINHFAYAPLMMRKMIFLNEAKELLEEIEEICVNCGEYKEAHDNWLCPSARDYGKRFKACEESIKILEEILK